MQRFHSFSAGTSIVAVNQANPFYNISPIVASSLLAITGTGTPYAKAKYGLIPGNFSIKRIITKGQGADLIISSVFDLGWTAPARILSDYLWNGYSRKRSDLAKPDYMSLPWVASWAGDHQIQSSEMSKPYDASLGIPVVDASVDSSKSPSVYNLMAGADVYLPDQFLSCNELTRPPLTDLEIKLMPNWEVVCLYYNLNSRCEAEGDSGTGGSSFLISNTVVSYGLPLRIAQANDSNLRRRVFDLRPELHSVVHPNTGVSYRVLVEPTAENNWLNAYCASMPDKTTKFINEIVVGVGGMFTSGIAAIALAVFQVVQSTLEAVQVRDLQNFAFNSNTLTNEVVSGIVIMAAIKDDPMPTVAQLAELKKRYYDWQGLISYYSPLAYNINKRWYQLPMPHILLAVSSHLQDWDIKPLSDFSDNDDNCVYQRYHTAVDYEFSNTIPGDGIRSSTHDSLMAKMVIGAHGYTNHWKPYHDYFFSKTVSDMVLHPKPKSSIVMTKVTGGQPVSQSSPQTKSVAQSVNSNDELLALLKLAGLLLLI